MKKLFFIFGALFFINATAQQKNKAKQPKVRISHKITTGDAANKKFTLVKAQDWQFKPLQGIDSTLGAYIKGKDRIDFEMGWYSAEIDPKKATEVEETQIDGRKAVLALEDKKCMVAVVYATERDRLRLSSCNPSDKAAVKEIFKSVKFK